MRSASLPGRPGHGRPDRSDEALVGVAGDQFDPVQAAGGQVTEELQPTGAVLGGGDVDAEDLPVAVGVDTGRDQGVHPGDPAALPDLQHQGVRGDERVRALVEPAVPERLDLGVKVFGHDRHLGLRQS